MNDRVLAIDLSVTCVDGSSHDSVSLRVENNCRIFETLEGRRLAVATIDRGVIAASPMEYAIIFHKCPMMSD